MEDLTARKQQILRAVVIEYVESAEPVGSGLLVERYRLGVGPATVRHELADMSERGYLEQPHTSAGRIPSDVGYRYYVDRLAEPNTTEIASSKVKEIKRSEHGLEDLLQEVCKVMSRLTHYASIATTVGERHLSIQGVTLTGITRERALLAVLFSNGMVENRILEAHPDITLKDIHEITTTLHQLAAGHKLKQVVRLSLPPLVSLPKPAQDLAAAAWRSFKSICKSVSAGKVVSDGTEFLLEHPEFQHDVKALGQIVSALQQEEVVQSVLPEEDRRAGVRIGSENQFEALRQVAIVASRFYINDDEAGAVAIAGPTRMRYDTTIPLVETAAKTLTEALSKLVK